MGIRHVAIDHRSIVDNRKTVDNPTEPVVPWRFVMRTPANLELARAQSWLPVETDAQRAATG
jgi:hypothetical protein